MKHVIFFLLANCVLVTSSCSQETKKKPFYDQIQAFKAQDKRQPPPQNAIVFVGSSSFAMWRDVQSYFPGYTIINRGFGGSGLKDAIEYEDDVITPYKPKQVVIYSGENDIATGTVSAEEAFQRFKTLFMMIRKDLPEASIAYVSMKPSPSREKFMPLLKEANQKIKDFLSKHKSTSYVDVYGPMLDSTGRPKADIFRDDSLHMNARGYAIWKEAITPHLMR